MRALVFTSLVSLAAAAGVVHAQVSAQSASPAPMSASQLAEEGVRLVASARVIEARAMFERARARAVEDGDRVLEGRAYWGLGRVAYLQKDGILADAHYARAIDLLAGAQANDLLGVLLLQRGAELFDLQEYAGAERHWRRSLDLVGPNGPWNVRAQLLRNLSSVPSIGLAARLEMIEEAARLVAGRNRPALEGLVLHALGDVLFVAGDYARALRETERAVALIDQGGNRSDLARALTSVGRIYRVHGQPEQALPYYTRALQLQEALGDGGAAVNNLLGIAIAQDQIGNIDASLDASGRAVALARTSSSVELQHVLLNQASLLSRHGRVADAERALAEADALPGDSRQGSFAHAVRGTVLSAAGRHADAIVEFERALTATPVLPTDSRVEVLDLRARALDTLGRTREAIAAADEALDALEALRTTLVPRDYFKRRFDALWSRVVAIAVRRLADAGEAGRALEVAERARARTLADLMAARDLERTPLLSSQASGTPAASSPATLAAGVHSGTRLASVASAASASLTQIREAAARNDTTILSFWTDADLTLAWVVPPSGDVRLVRVPTGVTALQREVESTFTAEPARTTRARPARTAAAAAPVTRGAEAFTLGRSARDAYRRLYDTLMAPVAALLPPAGSSLTIVPAGPLFRLSFAALQNPAGRYLLEDYRLSYVPSVSMIGQGQASAIEMGNASYLLVGNPVLAPSLAREQRLGPLPGAVREVQAIRRRVLPAPANTLTGTSASEAAVRSASTNAGVLHFATHAVVDDARPFDAFLALAPGASSGDDDGRLTAEEIYALDLSADLVVLSACRSATGPVTGDGLLGLTRAFFAAGARSVVATLWDIPDVAAGTILPRFYREWRVSGSKAEGLRRAQLSYLADLRAGKVMVTSPLGKTTLPEHPALWASLVLQGRP